MAAYFAADEIVFEVQGATVRLRFEGARGEPLLEGLDPQPGRANFLLGSEPARWRTNVPTYAGVAYRELYPGIDLRYGSSGSRLKSEFVVAPGADPQRIQVVYAGIDGLRLDTDGALILATGAGQLREEAPEVHQEIGGQRIRVPAAYRQLNELSVGFELGPYDRTQPLFIDPVITYATYLGGSQFDGATAIAADAAGNAYVTGWTESADFPTSSLLQGSHRGSTDVFVAKLNAAGNALVYCTYLGGSGLDLAYGIAVDGAGNAYVTGSTNSANFPKALSLQLSLAGGRDAFVAKLNATGQALVYSTYLGGNGNDGGNAIALDSLGNAYVAGDTSSTNFPVTSAFQTANRGRQDAFLTKLDGAGRSLLYSTYLGGSGDDRASGLAVDSAGNAYLTGATDSVNFPTFNPGQSVLKGTQDAFVTKLSATGNSLVYSTYFGGSGGTAGLGESGNAIAVDAGGNAYIVGTTNSTDFPTINPLQASLAGGGNDAFVAKLSPAGSALFYSTFLGGSGLDSATGVAVDSLGNVYLTGFTSSPNFPRVNPMQPVNAGGYDAFVAKLTPAGNALVYSSYLGGSNSDSGAAIALDGAGNVYIAGQTLSSNFPAVQALQVSNTGGFAAFVAKIADQVAGTPNVIAPAYSVGGPGLTTYVPVVLYYGGGPIDELSFWLSAPSGTVYAFEFSARIAASSKTATQQGSQFNVSFGGLSPALAASAFLGYARLTLPRPLAPGNYVLSITACSTRSGQTLLPCQGGQATLRVPASPVIDDNEFFVTQQYMDILGRLPDPGGLATFLIALNTGAASRSGVVYGFILSAEFFGKAFFVASCHRAVLGQDASFTSWLQDLTALRLGLLTPDGFIQALLSSPQYLQSYGNPDTVTFVTLLYRNGLGREPDPGGLSSLVEALNSGAVTRSQAVYNIIYSLEYLLRYTDRIFVELLYFSLLRRNPDPGGWNAHLSLLASGVSKVTLIENFLLSLEYRYRFN
jgi:hypothetical protein